MLRFCRRYGAVPFKAALKRAGLRTMRQLAACGSADALHARVAVEIDKGGNKEKGMTLAQVRRKLAGWKTHGRAEEEEEVVVVVVQKNYSSRIGGKKQAAKGGGKEEAAEGEGREGTAK